MLTLEQIKEKHGPSTFPIAVPEWGGEVLVKRLGAPDYIAITKLQEGDGEKDKFAYMAEVIKLSLINEDGSQMFTDENDGMLCESPLIVSRLGMEILRRNGLLKGEEKNSEGGQP